MIVSNISIVFTANVFIELLDENVGLCIIGNKINNSLRVDSLQMFNSMCIVVGLQYCFDVAIDHSKAFLVNW